MAATGCWIPDMTDPHRTLKELYVLELENVADESIRPSMVHSGSCAGQYSGSVLAPVLQYQQSVIESR